MARVKNHIALKAAADFFQIRTTFSNSRWQAHARSSGNYLETIFTMNPRGGAQR